MRDFGEILAENRKKKGYSQSDLVDLLSQEGIQVTTKAISKWETNAREPALHVFLTLCQLLDIEDIYESFFGENPYNIMSGLNEEGRNKLIEFADILKASKKFSPLSAKIIPFHHPVEITWEPVSAGTGNYLEDSVKETYDVGHLCSRANCKRKSTSAFDSCAGNRMGNRHHSHARLCCRQLFPLAKESRCIPFCAGQHLDL